MTVETFEKVQELGHVVLTAIRNECEDIREIREATTLSIGQVNYRVRKLEDLGLIELGDSQGRERQEVDGQIREYDAPKPARLTQLGQQYFEYTDRKEDLSQYENLTKEELVEKLHEHEQRIDRLESAIQMLKEQFQRDLS